MRENQGKVKTVCHCVSVWECRAAVWNHGQRGRTQEKESGSSNRSRGSFNPLAQILDALICSSKRGGLDKYRDGFQNHKLIRRLMRERDECVSGLRRGRRGRLRSLLLHSRKCNERGRQNTTCDLLTTFFSSSEGMREMHALHGFSYTCSILCIFFSMVRIQVHVCTGDHVLMTKPYDMIDRWIIFIVLTDPFMIRAKLISVFYVNCLI